MRRLRATVRAARITEVELLEIIFLIVGDRALKVLEQACPRDLRSLLTAFEQAQDPRLRAAARWRDFRRDRKEGWFQTICALQASAQEVGMANPKVLMDRLRALLNEKGQAYLVGCTFLEVAKERLALMDQKLDPEVLDRAVERSERPVATAVDVRAKRKTSGWRGGDGNCFWCRKRRHWARECKSRLAGMPRVPLDRSVARRVGVWRGWPETGTTSEGARGGG